MNVNLIISNKSFFPGVHVKLQSQADRVFFIDEKCLHCQHNNKKNVQINNYNNKFEENRKCLTFCEHRTVTLLS